MDTITIYHYMIIGLDIAILFSLGRSFLIHFLGRRKDKNYHTRWLIVCTCLFVANTFALITSGYAYFIYKTNANEILNLGRFADRYLMFFSYLFFNKIEERD